MCCCLFYILTAAAVFQSLYPPRRSGRYWSDCKTATRRREPRLIERNLRLVSHPVKKYYSRTNDTEDLVSIGTIGLIKAIDSFDPSKGTHWPLTPRCIENEILMYFRAQRKTSGEVHLGDAIEIDKDGNILTLQDVIRDERDMEQELEPQKIRWEKVRRYIEAMPEGREREILVLRYGLDNQKPLTQREVAQRLNISRSYVSRIEKSVLTAIRRAVQPEENGKKQRSHQRSNKLLPSQAMATVKGKSVNSSSFTDSQPRSS